MFEELPRRRDAYQISADILRASGHGERKTRVMYASALNTVQLKRYTAMLIKQGLLAYDTGQRLFFVTDKGRQFVRSFDRYAETRDLLVAQQRALAPLLESTEVRRLETAQDRV